MLQWFLRIMRNDNRTALGRWGYHWEKLKHSPYYE